MRPIDPNDCPTIAGGKNVVTSPLPADANGLLPPVQFPALPRPA